MNKNNKNEEIKEETIEILLDSIVTYAEETKKLRQKNNDASQIIMAYIKENDELRSQISDLKETINHLEKQLEDVAFEESETLEMQLAKEEQFYYERQSLQMEDF